MTLIINVNATHQRKGNDILTITGIQKYQLYINDSLNVDNIAPTQTTISPSGPLEDGVYRWFIRAIDTMGNHRDSDTKTVKIDGSMPTSTIAAPSANAILRGNTVAISGAASDGTGSGIKKIEVSTDGGQTWHDAEGTTAWSYSWLPPLVNENFTIKSRVTDNLDNVEIPGVGINVAVHNVPFSLTISPVNSPTNKDSQTITGKSEGAVIVTVEMNSQLLGDTVISGNTWDFTITILAKGVNTIKVTATDIDGNILVATTTILKIQKGDVNGDGNIDVTDAIMALQIMTGINSVSQEISTAADVNGDGMIGIEEVIFIMQKVAEIR